MNRKTLAEDVHYVYYLVCPTTNELLYIGRAQNPKNRVKEHMRRLKRPLALEYARRFTSLEAASVAELAAIRAEKPPLNIRLVSSSGHLGHVASQKIRDTVGARMREHWSNPANRQELSERLKGVPKSAQHRENISKGLKGLAFTPERCENISAGLKGKLKGIPKTPEHKAKLREVLARGRATQAARKQNHA